MIIHFFSYSIFTYTQCREMTSNFICVFISIAYLSSSLIRSRAHSVLSCVKFLLCELLLREFLWIIPHCLLWILEASASGEIYQLASSSSSSSSSGILFIVSAQEFLEG